VHPTTDLTLFGMTDKGNIPNSYIAHSAAPAAAVWGAGDER